MPLLSNTKRESYLSLGVLILFLVAAVFNVPKWSTAADAANFSPYVDEAGSISLPSDFRMKMVHLGSWFVPEGGASGFHDVYTERESAVAYRATGKFPDGATLVKELRHSNAGNYTTGANVSYATGEIKQWFVMVKDTQGRFSENPHWGDGWGWALIKTDQPQKNVSAGYKTECIGCHLPAKETDWIYVEAYPTLMAPK
jgi:hypothetical protein